MIDDWLDHLALEPLKKHSQAKIIMYKGKNASIEKILFKCMQR